MLQPRYRMHMQISPTPTHATPSTSATTSGLGRLREWEAGVPEHGEFVLARSEGATPLAFSSKPHARMWMSPDDDLDRVLVEARAAAEAAGQAVAIITAEPGHWQQLFVVPLFSVGTDGVMQAVAGVSQLGDAGLRRSGHLVALADATTSLDVRSWDIDAELMPPRARPGAFRAIA